MALKTTFEKLGTNLLTKYGKSITYNNITKGTFDPATFTTTPDTVVTTTVKALIGSFKTNDLSQVIQAGDVKVTFDYQIEPTKDDTLVIDSETYNIVEVIKTYAEDSKVLYVCVARK